MRTTTTEKRVDILQKFLLATACPTNWYMIMGLNLHQLHLHSSCNRIESITPVVHHITQPLMVLLTGRCKSSNAPCGLERMIQDHWGTSWLVFSLRYRNTPCSTTGRAPAELFLQRTLHTHLDILRPSVESRGATQQQQHKTAHNRCASDHSFALGQTVLVKNWRGEPCWVKGVIVRVVGAVQYEVDVGESTTQRCHSLYWRGRGNL